MTVKTSKDLDRKSIFARTQDQYLDPKNYKLYISEKTNPELNRKIKSGEVELTLKDLIDQDDKLVPKSS